MIAYSEAAQKYSELKRQFAIAYPTHIDDYMDGKDTFIQERDRKAAPWRRLPMD
jgi:GrpB-like predicted nucleotidyltransferase (UPF0157 family)